MDATQDVNVAEVAADIFLEFLEVAIHTLLYVREIYPAAIFRRKKKYGVPVQISGNSELNRYIEELLCSLKSVMERQQVHYVAIVILSPKATPLERFIFEITQPMNLNSREDMYLMKLEQSLRALLLKLSISDSLLAKNTPGCSWTVQIKTSTEAMLSLQRAVTVNDFQWIEAESSQVDVSDKQLVPIRALDSGILKVQLYVEESGNK